MSDILVILLSLVIYIIGVLVSMIVVTRYNKKEEVDVFPEFISAFSWFMVLIIILFTVLFPIVDIIISPFRKFQEYLNDKL